MGIFTAYVRGHVARLLYAIWSWMSSSGLSSTQGEVNTRRMG